MKFYIAFLAVLLSIDQIHGYKVLYLFPFASKSHKNIFDSLILELARRNHEVTVISPYLYSEPVKNVREIQIEESVEMRSEETQKWIFSSIGTNPMLTMFFFPLFTVPICENYFKHPQVKKLLEDGKQFDVVIVSAFVNECALATAPLLGKQIISHSPGAIIPWSGIFVPQPPSYVPQILLSYTSEMNFFQRLNNFLTLTGINLIYDYYILPKFQAVVSKHIPENPSIVDARRQVTLFLTSSDPVYTSPRPSMPNIISLGGIHCKKAKSLPKDLEDFIQKSGDDGFIYFSLGSNAQSRFLPHDIKVSLLAAFSKLKQKVIWKYEEELKDAPGNIKVIKWAPQQDILGHPKIRGFITHGGLLSLQETLYNGVPVVAVPILGDQLGNAARVEELEIGVKVDFNNITGDSITEALNKILEKKYKDNMKKYSAIFRDQYMPLLEQAAFWVDYVIENNGADHLKSAGEELNFFQYFLIDVILFILVIFMFLVYVLFFIGKLIYKKFICSNKIKKKEE